jgi:hypothetical protein
LQNVKQRFHESGKFRRRKEKKNMFTVKLIKGKVTKIVAAKSISIFPSGMPSNKATVELASSNVTIPEATNQVREMSLEINNEQQTFFVGYEGASCIHGDVALWDCAYIENANGATTEKVCAF